MGKSSLFSTCLPTLDFFFLLDNSQTEVKWYHWRVSLHSLMISDVEHVSRAWWPFVYLHLRNVCSRLMLSFKLEWLFFCCWVVWIPYVIWILVTGYIYSLLKISSTLFSLSDSLFVLIRLLWQKLFNLMKLHSSVFVFVSCLVQKMFAHSSLLKCFIYFFQEF